LKRERDICIQTIIPSKNMAFVLTPALRRSPFFIIIEKKINKSPSQVMFTAI